MKRAPLSLRGSARSKGSAVLIVMLLCACIGVVIQSLVVVTLCVQHAVVDERAGRARLGEKDAALAWVQQGLLREWVPIGETSLPDIVPEGGAVFASAQNQIASPDWLMGAVVRHDPDRSVVVVSAAVERGRDGIDLPLAALVARELTGSAERQVCWEEKGWALELDPASAATSAVPCFLIEPPLDPVLGPTVDLSPLAAAWNLEGGWAAAVLDWVGDSSAGAGGLEGAEDAAGAPGRLSVAPGPQTVFLAGDAWDVEHIPDDIRGRSGTDTPVLVVVTGAADLDARGLGDLHGVIVVDGGSVYLDGTTLHGAVFVTETVALGETGRVLYSRENLRWATDRSLQRVRLVPGTRSEEIE